ncbi:hypothetical protein BC936DRAFT_149305 [Jimgerdemannia flammicorona]|uniref:Uncharacterized protein n=1 Tax=Jimgerdemannia flammicorona TaxID=994334 RepID=A0A433D139_9FUNG|nr:hypothetical protein BC936DRAFT_149305 [Jimgerdemannia flammicorona]
MVIEVLGVILPKHRRVLHYPAYANVTIGGTGNPRKVFRPIDKSGKTDCVDENSICQFGVHVETHPHCGERVTNILFVSARLGATPSETAVAEGSACAAKPTSTRKSLRISLQPALSTRKLPRTLTKAQQSSQKQFRAPHHLRNLPAPSPPQTPPHANNSEKDQAEIIQEFSDAFETFKKKQVNIYSPIVDDVMDVRDEGDFTRYLTSEQYNHFLEIIPQRTLPLSPNWIKILDEYFTEITKNGEKKDLHEWMKITDKLVVPVDGEIKV